MFIGCSSLQRLDLSRWKMPSATDIASEEMFAGCTALREIVMDGCDSYTVSWIMKRIKEAGLASTVKIMKDGQKVNGSFFYSLLQLMSQLSGAFVVCWPFFSQLVFADARIFVILQKNWQI